MSNAKKVIQSGFRFPQKLVSPIASFLSDQMKKLEYRKYKLVKDDPFDKIDRGGDKAAPDTEITDRVRHESLYAVKDQIERKIVQMRKALSRIKVGKYGICEICGLMIDTDRLMVFPEATLCLSCERKKEKK